MELWKYTQAVEANYQRLSEIFLSKESESAKVERLLWLTFNLTPVPSVKPWYAIWSDGILAEALACFPKQAFPHLMETLRSSESNITSSSSFILFKSLTMWGDSFAEALSNWLDVAAEVGVGATHASPLHLQQKALHGLSLYAKQLHIFCSDVGDESFADTEKKLQRENYPDLALFLRNQPTGAPPTSYLSGAPRLKLLQKLSQLLVQLRIAECEGRSEDRLGAGEQRSRGEKTKSSLPLPPHQSFTPPSAFRLLPSDESRLISLLRCLWQLYNQKLNNTINLKWLPTVLEKIEEIAKSTTSRSLEREAVIALCRLDCDRGQEYIRQHWFQDGQRRPMAAEVLGMIRTEAAFEMLRELVKDANPETRRKAVSSIEAFDPAQALALLDLVEENQNNKNNKEVQRQLILSRSKLSRRQKQKSLSFLGEKPPDPVYSISSLALLRLVPMKSVFSEKELNASVKPEIIADVSSSRRYAVEVGLLDRMGDSYRLSEIGLIVHLVETYLKEGLRRFAEPRR